MGSGRWLPTVPGCRVVLADVSEAALRLCKQNVRRNELNARVTCVQADALEPPDAALWDLRRDRLQPALYPHRGHRGGWT